MNVRWLVARRGFARADWTDWLSWAYLLLGVLLMFGPVVWLVLSSFKTPAALNEFPPRLLPYGQKSVSVAGQTERLPVFRVKLPDGSQRELAELHRIGIQATMVDPAMPSQEFKVNIRDHQPVRELHVAGENYTEIFGKFSFGTYLWNSVFITFVATAITLLFNAMAAFGLSKYRFAGRDTMFAVLMSVFTFVFANRSDYALDLVLGLFLYDHFQESTKTGLVSLHAKGYLIGRSRFPRWLLVVASTANPLLVVATASVAIVSFLALSGRAPGPAALALYAGYVALSAVVVIGFSLAASVLFVRYRDLNQVWDVVVQAGFFVSSQRATYMKSGSVNEKLRCRQSGRGFMAASCERARCRARENAQDPWSRWPPRPRGPTARRSRPAV